jgi:hypothetical protein
MVAAEDHDRERRRLAVGARAQAPPHAQRVDDADARLVGEDPLDEALRGVRLPAAGAPDDGDRLLEAGVGDLMGLSPVMAASSALGCIGFMKSGCRPRDFATCFFAAAFTGSFVFAGLAATAFAFASSAIAFFTLLGSTL